jgi:hypothetical protein
MTVKRLLLALPAFALLAACGGNAPANNDGRAASGEVLEGTISDEMLPLDSVRSEPPLEDPEAFAKARSVADEGGAAEGEEGAEGEQPAADGTASPTPDVTPLPIED